MAKNMTKQRHCYYCVKNTAVIDYKDVATLRRFTSSFMKIGQRKRTGLCTLHQRKVSRAIKQARIAGLIPYMPK